VVVQTEVAERMAAHPGSKAYGYLSVATQLNSRPELVLEIPRAAFTPPPEVASTLVTLRLPGGWEDLRRGGLLPEGGQTAQERIESEEEFLEFVKLCFSKKRKTLVNNLRELAEPEQVRKALGTVGLRPDARAEQISISNFATLYVALRE
jgi:16S rRNA (adenine1518-N6/adenine1519-N6)-dimethyltransferase